MSPPNQQKHAARTALTVCVIFAMTMTTASRLLQSAATVSLLSTSLSFASELSTPMSNSFDKIWPSIFVRNGSCAGSRDMRCARERNSPHSLLYLRVRS
jgi:hypothetical protein